MAVTEHEVPRALRGKTVEEFLRRALPAAPHGLVLSLLQEGRVTLEGKPVRAGRKLWGGERLRVEGRPPPPPRRVEGPEVRVLADSADVVLVDKPAGWTVEREPGQDAYVELLASRLRGFDVGGSALPGVVHRLDRFTTGAMAFARTDAGLAMLRAAFDEGRVDKRYRAVVLGSPPDEARLDTPYARDPEHPRRYTTRVASHRRAALSFRVLRRLGGAAELEIRLETGRTHQVRCQLAESGFPVLGDGLYGGDAALAHPAARAMGRHALHAARLEIQLTGTTLTGESPLPADFEAALRELGAGA